jgi:hypothetical protein
MPMKKMVLKRKGYGEDLTSRWGIGRFCSDCRLLSSGLKLHKDKMIRMKSGFMLRKEKMLTSIRTLLDVLFFLAARGATRDGPFLLSVVELMRVGSDVAYLDIS